MYQFQRDMSREGLKQNFQLKISLAPPPLLLREEMQKYYIFQHAWPRSSSRAMRKFQTVSEPCLV